MQRNCIPTADSYMAIKMELEGFEDLDTINVAPFTTEEKKYEDFAINIIDSPKPRATLNTDYSDANQEPTAYRSELVESFVIYELEPSTSSSSSAPPTILNSRLRKQPKVYAAPATRISAIAPTSTPTTSTLSDQLPKASPTVPELKVKCFCRLGNNDNVTSSNEFALKEFYEKMFNETRLLPREQQRKVQMTLLEAICQAEEDVEAGRYCEKCCTNT